MTKMPNRYAGDCFRCGLSVRAGDGLLYFPGIEDKDAWGRKFKESGSKALPQHVACAERFAGTTQHYLFDDRKPVKK